MNNKILSVAFVFLTLLFTACGNNNDTDELLPLDVQFDVPESLEVGETLLLEAIVTYGDEFVVNADEVVFEVWEKGDQQNSDMIDAENNGDGTYTTELTFNEDGIFEMYAHTTAHDLHTMPKREIIIGEGGDYEDVEENDQFHTEGFDMYFNELEVVKTDDHVDLTVNLELNNEALIDAKVRYEIWEEKVPDERDWVDAEEENDGIYTTQHTFNKEGIYHIQVHVEDDDELHEHKTYTVEVSN